MKHLNIGCGTDIRKGYLNLDYINGSGVDVRADITKKLPFKDDTFETVYASHCLEHLSDWIPTVCECWRILKNGGLLVIRVPYGIGKHNSDAQHVRFFYPDTMDIFTMPKRVSSGLDAHNYNGLFKVVQRKVMRHFWYHRQIERYIGIHFFEKFKYRFPPIGVKIELVWILRKVKS